MAKTMDDLVNEVGGLVIATNTLLGEITNSKSEVDTLIDEAKQAAATVEANATLSSQKISEVEANATKATNSANVAKVSADSASEITGLSTVADAIKLAVKNGRVPIPDFYLPLHNSLDIKIGKGTSKQVDVSQAQNGTLMVDLPEYKADFTRASKATYINREGKLVEAGINEPRFEKEGILIEGSSTNLYLSDVHTCLGTDGNNNAERIFNNFGIDIAVGKYTAIKPTTVLYGYSFTSTSSFEQTTYSITFVYKKDLNLKEFRDSNTERLGVAPAFTVREGLPHQPLYGQTIQSFMEIGDYVFVYLTVPVVMHNFVHLAAHFDTEIDSGYICEMGIIQVEKLPSSSSYIPASRTPATRSAETLLIEQQISDINDSFTISGTGSSNSTGWSYLVGIAAGSSGLLFRSSSLVLNRYDMELVSSISERRGNFTGTYEADAGYGLYVNGVKNGSSPAVNLTSSETYQKFYIGAWDGLRHLYGHIKDVKIWNQALTPEQVANI